MGCTMIELKRIMNKFLYKYCNTTTVKYWLALIPIIVLGLYLYKHSINVPFWDQWEIVPILENVNAGKTNFHDFWQQHNEHRLLFPRILMIISAVATDWNLKAEIFISFSLAVLSFIVLLRVIKNLEAKKDFKVPLLLPLLLGSIWFSLLQYENWLWGWQIQWYLNVLAVTGVLYSVSKLTLIPKAGYKYILIAISAAFVAQYSLGNGVLIWPLLIAALIYLKVGKKKVGLTIGSAIASTGLYYFNYTDPVGDPSKALFLEQPFGYIKYVSAYIGRPLSYNARLAIVLGVLLAALFLGLCTYLFFKHPDRFRKSVPFIMLGLYSLASAGITGLSRLGFGFGQSLSSRYTTISSLLLVGVIVLVIYNKAVFKTVLKKAYLPVAYISVTVVVVGVLTNMNWARHMADDKTQYLKDIKSCTSAPDPYEICLLSTYPSKEIVNPRLKYLKSINWGGY